MLLDEIIQILREVSRDAHVVDNERIDDRLWEGFIMLKRNQFIKNYMNEKGTYEQNTLQYEVLDLSAYDSALDIGGISIGKKILRSTPCPNMIEGRWGVAIYELATADVESKTIASVSMDRLRWCGNGVTNKDTIYAAFYDGRFYVKSNSNIQKPIAQMRVVGVFADPTQVSTFNRLTDDYPINDYMVAYVSNAIMQGEFNIMTKNLSDTTNDASGNINEQGKV
jgi:hypothetical protein